MADDDTTATSAWTRRDTPLAALMAMPTVAAMPTAMPTATPSASPTKSPHDTSPTTPGRRTRTLSTLPRIVTDPSGAITLQPATEARYHPQKTLGVGGMGIVERAEDRDIGRTVAIKRLLPECTHPPGIARFIAEIQLLGSLDHPNVAPVHDVGVDEDGNYFFVMKYVEGQDLGEIIAALAAGDPEASARWTHEARAEIIVGVLRALEYAHRRGILHRDIKPENVMVGASDEVWLIDWGIATTASATAAQPETEAPGLIGTPAYMSPEQVTGGPLDHRSDLYAVAATFFEFLTLRHYLADHSGSLPQLLEAIEREAPPVGRPGGYADQPHGPPPLELQMICKTGLARDPAARHPSAAVMRRRIQAYLEGRNPIHCPVSFTKRVLRSSTRLVDRSPRLTIALFAGSALAAVFGLVALVALFVRAVG